MASLLLLALALTLGFLCGIATSDMTFVDEDTEMAAAQKIAQHHLEELQRSMGRISSLRKRTLRAKRDTHGAKSIEKSEFLFNSVRDFCLHIQSFDARTGQNESTVDEPTTTSVSWTAKNEVDEFEEVEPENWSEPEVRPISVHAIRQGKEKVRLSFSIKQSVSSVVSRLAGFDLEQLELPKGHGNKTQEASFLVDTSTYCEDREGVENQFDFVATEEVRSNINLLVDVCRFDKFQNESLPWENRTWETREGPITENIILPKVRIDLNNITDDDDDIIVVPGRNESFEITAEIDGSTYVNIYSVFYDRRSKAMGGDNSYLTVDKEDYLHSTRKNDTTMFTLVELLNVSTVRRASQHGDSYSSSSSGSDGDDDVIKQIRARVTVVTESGSLTGKVYISAFRRQGGHYNRTIVRIVTWSQMIKVRKANKRAVFPRRKAFLSTLETYVCYQGGNENRQTYGRNCTLSCRAFGRDLHELTISKISSHVPIYRQMSYKRKDQIYTIVDVGPASSAVEGDYLCTVTGFKGYMKSQELQLVTDGFPQIDLNNTSVTSLDNVTSLIKCTVRGRQPIVVNIDVIPYSYFNRMPDDWNMTRRTVNESEDGQQTVMVTLEVPTNDLRYPASTIEFSASSPYGNDFYSLHLDEVIPRYTGAPFVVSERSSIVNYGNGTTAITCTAEGRTSQLDIWISIGGQAETFRIDYDAGYVRVERPIPNGKSVTLFADTRSLIRPTSWLYCGVRDEYGDDTEDYYLRDYIDWNLKDT